MSWTEIYWSCRYKGKTLPQVLFSDPDWFFFMVERGNFNNKGVLADEAMEFDRKACNIKIPQREGKNLVAEYYVHQPTGKFQDMRLVPRSQESHRGSIRSNVIDLSVPRQISNCDKQGYRGLIRDVKFHIFGSPRYQMTKARCESFFDNDNNFNL